MTATNKFPKLITALLIFIFCCLFTTHYKISNAYAQSSETTLKKLRLGVVTGANPVRIINQWRYLINAIESSTGLPVELVLRENYLDLLDAMNNDEVDLVEGGAYLYAKMHEKAGARILIGELRKSTPYYHSVIIVSADSGINNLNQLKGKSFVFTDPDSASGYLYPRIMLADAGILDPENYFSSTYFSRYHDASLGAVLAGTVDAAGVGDFFMPGLSLRDQKKLKVIAKSEPIPSGPISYSPRLSQKLVGQIRTALLDLHNKLTPAELKEMTVDQFVPISDDVYDFLRQRMRQLEKLPTINDSIKYRTAPQAFNAQIEKILRKWQFFISLPICFLILAVVLSFIILRRKVAKSLKAKMIFAFISISVVILTLFSASTILDLRTKINKLSNEYLWDLKSFEAGSANAVSEGRLNLLPVFTNEFANRQNIVYTRIIRNGTYVTDSMRRESGKNIAENVLNNNFYLAHTLTQSVIETLDPIVVGDKMWGMVQTGFSLTPIESLVMRTFVANIIIILVATALSIMLAYFLSHHITNPLAKLMSSIKNFGQGNLEPLDIKGSDDIGQLAKAFEQMRIDLKIKDDLLQSKVEELDTAQTQLQEICQEQELTDIETLPPSSDAELNDLKDKIALIGKQYPKLKELRETVVIGNSPSFIRTIRDIYIRSQDSDPVLIYGESGSGKTGTAYAIHKLSARADEPFGEFNCAEFASADPLIVLGKLFGYGKDCGIQGIPREGQPGLLQKYDGGTLFLDEVTSLPAHAQALLLLPLEGRPFNPAAGQGSPVKVNVRFIFASNTPLLQEVEKGSFRKDLIRRMRMRGAINIPPLRERKEDIITLAKHFLDLWINEKGHQMDISGECLKYLENWDYASFNVGELSSVIRTAADQASFGDKKMIDTSHLPVEMRQKTDLKGTITSENISWADEMEMPEILTLRKNRFQIAPSEIELGYPKNSKTLTNHFRGICYKVLYNNEWQIKPAVAVLVGKEASQDVINRVWRKLEQYLKGLEESVSKDEEKRLFNNLPQKYHQYIEQAVRKYRKI